MSNCPCGRNTEKLEILLEWGPFYRCVRLMVANSCKTRLSSLEYQSVLVRKGLNAEMLGVFELLPYCMLYHKYMSLEGVLLHVSWACAWAYWNHSAASLGLVSVENHITTYLLFGRHLYYNAFQFSLRHGLRLYTPFSNP